MDMIQIEDNNADLKSVVRFVSIAIISISIIIMVVFSAYIGVSIFVYATSNSTILRSSTNASSLEVLLVPLSNVSNKEMHFRVGFLQPNTDELQRHVDFNFIVLKDGKEVFSASNQTGQPQIPLYLYLHMIFRRQANIQLRFLYSEFCLTQSCQKRLSLGLNTEKLNYKGALFKFCFTMKMSVVIITTMDNLFLTSHTSLRCISKETQDSPLS